MSSLNYMELCRLCLVKERVSIPIFEGEGDVRQIFLKIASCLPVKVARDDKLPKKICDDCMFKLDSAYQFWNTTANAEKQLLQWLGEVSNEDKKAVPSNTIETEQLVLKEEAVEQETSDITKTLSRVEAVLDDERGGSDDEDTESEEEGSNSEDSGDDEPPGKEEAESEEEEEAFEPLEPTTFVNVSLAGSDEAGPSGIQQPAQTATSAQQQMAPPPSQQQQQVAPSTSSAVVAAAPVVAAPSASGSSVLLYSIAPSTLTYNCVICGANFDSQATLSAHMVCHNNTRNFQCAVCKKECKTIYILNRHLAVHKERVCPVCKKIFHSIKKFNDHMVMHNPDYPYTCEICGRKFKRNHALKQHNQRVHTGMEKRFECPICKLKTFMKADMNSHMRRHQKDFTFFCDICGKGHYTASDLKLHMNLHSTEKSFQCELCPKKFLMKGSLNKHYITAHDKTTNSSKLYECETCGEILRNRYHFTRHFRTHTGEKEVYLCDICGKGLASSESLAVHKRSHTGEKPFECEECGKYFSSKKGLLMHVRIHTGERPFACKECGKSFNQQSTLIVHMRYHTGQRPYKCDHCGKGFVTLSVLKTHKKTPCKPVQS